ncbi:lipid biosynthesis B12-binding/radical SAM protein [Desulfurivibrio dismutans]|uniref:lipid biosynthesis B12-binding/radical SAM protein n=1 Tax=Desulfurivibrio dismutans TaxID=1398908 RepID=UPI0023DA3AF5|nr:lipid biosynthesis B12-binding/radical SAM protein [Desulfurivibrio alkaliphilus]MDF1614725.1 lipid biosynthesis B12-binding/radical SAM protein [Desulfurivibrio alkaliphilus]
MNCLLVSVNQAVVPYPVYPLGVAYLCGSLQQAGHVAEHFDLLADGGAAGLRQRLIERRYDLIGLSIRNLDTVDSCDPNDFVPEVAAVVALIREVSPAPVVLGGPAFSLMPEQLLGFLCADYGVVGEGEVLLPWLADELAAGRPPGQKILRNERRVDFWPRPVYDESPLRYYLAHGGMLGVQTKRGCPYHCAYCSYPTIEGHTLRYRDPDETAAEVARLVSEHSARYIFFTDSVFNDGAGQFRRLAEALIRNGNTTPWCAFFRPQNLEREDLRLLKRAGLAAMELGTDAACDRTLAGLDKGFDFDQVLRANRLAVEEGVPCAHFVMFGGPDEDRRTLTEGLDNLSRLEKCIVFAFSGIRILPGTALAARAVADGVITADQSLLTPTFYFSPQLPAAELNRELAAAFAPRTDRIFPVSQIIGHLTVLHEMGHTGPLWDFLLRPPRVRNARSV